MSRPRSGTDGGHSNEMEEIDIEDGTTYYFDEKNAKPKYWWQHPKYKPIWMALAVVLIGAILATLFIVTLLGKHETIDLIGLDYPDVVSGKKGAVAADNRYCSDVGVQILKEGGNSIDAAIATTICLGVRQPHSSGIGGGCVMTIRLANGTEEVIDAREVAPLFSFKDMYANNSDGSVYGALSAAIPGELKGLEVAYQRYGSKKVSWERLFTDSIRMAREGFPIGEELSSRILASKTVMQQRKDCNILPIFAPNGVVYNKGDILKMENLANTLENVAKNGTWSFYNGNIAENMVKDVVEGGGIFKMEDLSSYSVKISKPLRGTFRGDEILCPGPPFSGCLILIETLNVMERMGVNYLKGADLPAGMHVFVESLKFAFANRVGLSDPDFALDPEKQKRIVEGMLSKDHANDLKERIDMNKVFDPTYYVDLSPYVNITNESGTTHLSVIDQDRNVVALTSTVNGYFGSKFMSPSTGIILNNEMDDFSVPSTPANIYGVPPSEANFIVKGKRPVSSMVPTIFLRDGKPKFTLGASGGTRIPTSVLQVALGVLGEEEPLQAAIWEPRLHCQWIPNYVTVESNYDHYVHSEDSYQKLKAVGNKIEIIRSYQSAVQAIWVDDENELHAVSDPRKSGHASAY